MPSDRPFDAAQLHEIGISNALAAKYVRSGWMERLDRGIFKLAGKSLDRDQTLRFLERRLPDLHIASKSALGRHGYRQNVSFDEVVIVWTEARIRLPAWAIETLRLKFGQHQLFEDSLARELLYGRLPEYPEGPLVAQPECALLEMLSDVGFGQEVEEARSIMESVTRLRTSRLEELFAACRKVKPLRLCVQWAEEFQLPWANNVRDWVPADKRAGRWVGRLRDGTVLSLPPI
jgi:hypothetical protein